MRLSHYLVLVLLLQLRCGAVLLPYCCQYYSAHLSFARHELRDIRPRLCDHLLLILEQHESKAARYTSLQIPNNLSVRYDLSSTPTGFTIEHPLAKRWVLLIFISGVTCIR